MVNLDHLSNEDAYALLFILMSKQKDKAPYSILSELAYILDKDSFLNFITYYGGTTITIPTADEFHKAARVLVLYNSYVTQGLSWKDSLSLAGYEEEETFTAKMELKHFQKALTEKKAGKK